MSDLSEKKFKFHLFIILFAIYFLLGWLVTKPTIAYYVVVTVVTVVTHKINIFIFKTVSHMDVDGPHTHHMDVGGPQLKIPRQQNLLELNAYLLLTIFLKGRKSWSLFQTKAFCWYTAYRGIIYHVFVLFLEHCLKKTTNYYTKKTLIVGYKRISFNVFCRI